MTVNPYFGKRKNDEKILFGWKKDERIWGINGWCFVMRMVGVSMMRMVGDIVIYIYIYY